MFKPRRLPLYEELVRDSSFYHTLHRYDKDLSAQTRAARCSRCRGKLDSARYPRKPKGAPTNLVREDKLHHSLCCRSCNKRHNPPSLRFFGHRHYLGMAVVLISAMIGGITEKRAGEMKALVGVSIRTLRRWREWWREIFPQTPFWKRARARFDRPVDVDRLPQSLLERFRGESLKDRILRLLFFLSPITTSWPGAARLAMPG
jgi:hypothetical protein